MRSLICWSIMCIIVFLSGSAAAQYAGAVADPRVRPSAYVQHGQYGANLDWQCGAMSYTRPGYPHQGTDLAIPWTAYGVSFPHVSVRAGVRGKVVATYNVCADVCTTGNCICANAQGTGNFVQIADRFNRNRVFMHLRKGSVLVRAGDTVEADTVVGEIGSSGFSTGPHLHDEFREGSVAFEPFAGTCASSDGYLRQISFWTQQPSYQATPSNASYACAVEPGRFVDGYRDEKTRKAFQLAYGYRGYAGLMQQLGCPKTPDGAPSYVHDVVGVDVQDFVQDDASHRFAGSDDGHTALVHTPGTDRAYLLHSGFWGTYKCLPMNVDIGSGKTMGAMGGTSWLGSAMDNEHRPTQAECSDCASDPVAVRQNFERGYMSYRSDGVIRLHLDGQTAQVEAIMAKAASACGASLVVQGNPPTSPQPTASDGRPNVTVEWNVPADISVRSVEVWGYGSHPDTSWAKLCDLGVAGSTQRYVCTFNVAQGGGVTFGIRFVDAQRGERWVFDQSCSPQGGCGKPIGSVVLWNGTNALVYQLVWNGYGPSSPAVYYNARIEHVP